jgi:hypothetical protein
MNSAGLTMAEHSLDTNIHSLVMARPSGPRKVRLKDRPVRAIHVLSLFEVSKRKKNVDGPHKAPAARFKSSDRAICDVVSRALR